MSGFGKEGFDFEGFAALDDLDAPAWRAMYARMASEQSAFLAHEGSFRSPEYQWPRDPLHTWSRVWEYPYVFFHIEKCIKERPGRPLKVADIGSGVTFFPFALARLGCDVTCVDIDPVCAVDIPRAAGCFPVDPGKISAVLTTSEGLSLPDGSQDIVYCISVLEHIEHFERTLAEMARMLKPGGLLILTHDIDLKGNFNLSPEEFSRLQTVVDVHFTREHAARITHPSALLNTLNGPYKYPPIRRKVALKRLLRRLLARQWPDSDPRVDLLLAVYATVLRKR